MNKIFSGVHSGAKFVFDWAICLLPLFIVAGIIDYRFHGYFWAEVWRPLGGLAMFDFFSVASLFVWFLVGLYLVCALFVREIRPRLGFRWIYLVLIFLAAGVVVSKVSYVGLEPVIKSFYFQVYINYISPVLAFFVLYFGLSGEAGEGRGGARLFERFQKSFLVIFGLFGLTILFKYFFGMLPGGSVDYLDRLAWPYIDPFFEMKAESANWLSYIFGPLMILAVLRWLKRFRWRGFAKSSSKVWLESLVVLISGVILLLTKSYTGIGVTGLLCLYLLFINVPKSWRKYVVAGVLVLMIGFVATQYNTRKFQILIGNDTQETSLNRRSQIYTFNYEAFKMYPLEGIGPGNYQAFFRENVDELLPEHGIPEIELPPHPHNLVTFWWSDLGIFGFLAILMIYAMTFFGIFRPERNEYFVVVGYFLAHGLLDLPYAMEENSLMFWTFLALALAAYNVTTPQEKKGRKRNSL